METHQLQINKKKTKTEWIFWQFFPNWLYVFCLSSTMILAPDWQVRMFGDIKMPKVMDVSAYIYVIHQRGEGIATP